MAIKLYVGGLAYAVADKELEEMFAAHGKVTSAKVITDRDSGQSKGFGFVEMADDEEGRTAIKELNGKDVSGRSLTVNQARPQENRASGSFNRSY